MRAKELISRVTDWALEAPRKFEGKRNVLQGELIDVEFLMTKRHGAPTDSVPCPYVSTSNGVPEFSIAIAIPIAIAIAIYRGCSFGF